jgi:hypothetical protein
MIRYTIKLRMGMQLTLLLFLMAIGMVGIYGIERANAGVEQQYREDVLVLGKWGHRSAWDLGVRAGSGPSRRMV